jgi:hypothetical protein
MLEGRWTNADSASVGVPGMSTGIEHLWSRAVATGSNQPQMPSLRKGQKQAKSLLPGLAVNDDS